MRRAVTYTVIEYSGECPLTDENLDEFKSLQSAKARARRVFAARKKRPEKYSVAVVDESTGRCYLVVRKIESATEAAERREQSRARHWRRTGVSDSTISWMKRGGLL